MRFACKVTKIGKGERKVKQEIHFPTNKTCPGLGFVLSFTYEGISAGSRTGAPFISKGEKKMTKRKAMKKKTATKEVAKKKATGGKVISGIARKVWPCVTCEKKIKQGEKYLLWHRAGKAQRAHEGCGQPQS